MVAPVFVTLLDIMIIVSLCNHVTVISDEILILSEHLS